MRSSQEHAEAYLIGVGWLQKQRTRSGGILASQSRQNPRYADGEA